MTTHQYRTARKTRARFGTLDTRTVEARALDALGAAVPSLEKRLGFSLSVTAQAQPDRLICAEVLIPDRYYTADNRSTIRAALRGAAYPLDVYAEIIPSPEQDEQ